MSSRTVLPTLRFRADLRTLAVVGLYYALVVSSYSLAQSAWGKAGFCAALCLVSFLCAVIAHNTVHSPVFESRLWNRLFQIALSPGYGHPVSMFVPGHNLSHHEHLQQPKDRMRTDKLRFRWNLLNQLFFGWVVGASITQDNIKYALAMRTKKPQWFAQLMLELGAYAVLIGVGLVLDWKRFLLFIVVPHQYAAWGIMGINFVQHDGCDGEHLYNHSRNIVGRFVNWLTFNNGFHGIHHMHPALHWSKLPEAHARELHPHVHPALEQPSLLAYCFRAYIWPGRRVRYDGSPLILGPPRQDVPWVPEAVAGRISPRALVEDFGATG